MGLPGTLTSADTIATPSLPHPCQERGQRLRLRVELRRVAERRGEPGREPDPHGAVGATTTASTSRAQRGTERTGRRPPPSPRSVGPRAARRGSERRQVGRDPAGPITTPSAPTSSCGVPDDRHRGPRDDLDRDAIRERRGHRRLEDPRVALEPPLDRVGVQMEHVRTVRHAGERRGRRRAGSRRERRAGCRRRRTAACRSAATATVATTTSPSPAIAHRRAATSVRVNRPHRRPPPSAPPRSPGGSPRADSTRDRTCSISCPHVRRGRARVRDDEVRVLLGDPRPADPETLRSRRLDQPGGVVAVGVLEDRPAVRLGERLRPPAPLPAPPPSAPGSRPRRRGRAGRRRRPRSPPSGRLGSAVREPRLGRRERSSPALAGERVDLDPFDHVRHRASVRARVHLHRAARGSRGSRRRTRGPRVDGASRRRPAPAAASLPRR